MAKTKLTSETRDKLAELLDVMVATRQQEGRTLAALARVLRGGPPPSGRATSRRAS